MTAIDADRPDKAVTSCKKDDFSSSVAVALSIRVTLRREKLRVGNWEVDSPVVNA